MAHEPRTWPLGFHLNRLLTFAIYAIGWLLGGPRRKVLPPPAEQAPAAQGKEPEAAPAPAPELAPEAAPAPAAEIAPAPSEPALIDRVEGEEKHEGKRPVGYVAPLGVRDDLRRIKGIGPQNEGRLHALGVWHYSQIASWSRENAQWVGGYLSFPDRVERERWVEQAARLAAGLDVGKPAPRADNSRGGGKAADLSEVKRRE